MLKDFLDVQEPVIGAFLHFAASRLDSTLVPVLLQKNVDYYGPEIQRSRYVLYVLSDMFAIDLRARL